MDGGISMEQLTSMGIVDAHAGLAAGDFTSVALTQALLGANRAGGWRAPCLPAHDTGADLWPPLRMPTGGGLKAMTAPYWAFRWRSKMC